MSTPPAGLLERYRWVILGLTSVVLAGAIAFLLLDQDKPITIVINPPLPTATHTASPEPSATASPAPLEIYVTGAVGQPDSRLQLPAGSRVEDAIGAAGGPTELADLTRVNLAQLLQDGDQIHVPSLAPTASADDSVPTSVDVQTATPNQPRLVNLNTATLEELEALPEIGPATAQAILDHRQEHGDFATIEAIMDVTGIGQATFDAIRALITVQATP